MPTRSEILDKLFDGYSDYPPHEEVNKIIQQECIAFAEFIKDNHYTRNLNSGDERWYKYFSVNEELPSGVMISSGVSEYFTTEQLYELYQQSLT